MPLPTNTDTIIITLDGNIGAGKTTFLEELRAAAPEYEIINEPVSEWMSLKNAEGKSMLELFYEDMRRWGYTFQNYSLLTRTHAMREAMATTTKRVIITERSILTDRYVFAEMLHKSGDIDNLELLLYMKWFNGFAADLPFRGIIHITTSAATAWDRIHMRGREGEKGIQLEYLAALDAQHNKWVSETSLPVLQISTEEGVSSERNIQQVREFVAGLVAEKPIEA